MPEPPESPRYLTKLAELFVAHPTVVLSGTRMAQELAISRSSVWRGIELLRQYGMRLRGHRATGYQLEAMPDLLLPALLAPYRKSGVFGRRVHHFFRVDSTQRAALAAAAAGETHGTLFVAEEQTAGRGRQGHSWASPAGQGIYLSLILRPPGPPAGALALNLAAGIAVADAARAAAGVDADLRWPNDLLVHGRKAGGVLLEMSAEATRIQHLVLGIGVNVNQSEFPPELAPLATSLRLAAGRPLSRLEVLAEILFSSRRAIRRFWPAAPPSCRRSSRAARRTPKAGACASARAKARTRASPPGSTRKASCRCAATTARWSRSSPAKSVPPAAATGTGAEPREPRRTAGKRRAPASAGVRQNEGRGYVAGHRRRELAYRLRPLCRGAVGCPLAHQHQSHANRGRAGADLARPLRRGRPPV